MMDFVDWLLKFKQLTLGDWLFIIVAIGLAIFVSIAGMGPIPDRFMGSAFYIVLVALILVVMRLVKLGLVWGKSRIDRWRVGRRSHAELRKLSEEDFSYLKGKYLCGEQSFLEDKTGGAAAGLLRKGLIHRDCSGPVTLVVPEKDTFRINDGIWTALGEVLRKADRCEDA